MKFLRYVKWNTSLLQVVLFVVLGSAPEGSALGQSKLVVAYYPSWMSTSYPHTVIAYKNVTHIAHAFIFPNGDGTLDLSGFSFYPALNQTAHLNGVKVVVAVGGWDLVRTPRFSQMVADSNARRRFVNALRDFCVTNNYDGAEIDWEYPSPVDLPSTSLLFKELRAAFDAATPRLTLSIAAPSSDWSGRYDWNVMSSVCDWIGVMTYDYYGSWTPKAGPTAPLYGNFSQTDQGWIDNSVSHYRAKGVPSSKLLIGIPFYGWQFNASSLYGTSTSATQIRYSSIVPYISQGWIREWDMLSRTPYLLNPERTRVITYDDSLSIIEKCAYVNVQNLGGAIVWALGLDYVYGQQPLLNAVGVGFNRAVVVPELLSDLAPDSFTLMQNYPNPFNAQTRVRYQVPRPGPVSLALHDVMGRKVRVLVDRFHEPGTFELNLLLNELPSGVYLCRLTAPGVALTKMLVVLR